MGSITNFEFRFAPEIRLTQLGRILTCIEKTKDKINQERSESSNIKSKLNSKIFEQKILEKINLIFDRINNPTFKDNNESISKSK